MKCNKALIAGILVISILAITVASQLIQITNSVTLDNKQTCQNIPYVETKTMFQNCMHYYNYTRCLNTTGPDTDCSPRQEIVNLSCNPYTVSIPKNRTECRPDNKFVITIDNGNAVAKKEIDFSDWGPCIYSNEDGCLIVTCVSRYDGAHQGQFVDCSGGKSCQKFIICDKSIKTFYKNSREDFAEEDISFNQNKLSLKEVPQ